MDLVAVGVALVGFVQVCPPNARGMLATIGQDRLKGRNRIIEARRPTIRVAHAPRSGSRSRPGKELPAGRPGHPPTMEQNREVPELGAQKFVQILNGKKLSFPVLTKPVLRRLEIARTRRTKP